MEDALRWAFVSLDQRSRVPSSDRWSRRVKAPSSRLTQEREIWEQPLKLHPGPYASWNAWKITSYNIGKTKTEMQQGYQAICLLLEYKGKKNCWSFAPSFSLEHHLLTVALNYLFFQQQGEYQHAVSSYFRQMSHSSRWDNLSPRQSSLIDHSLFLVITLVMLNCALMWRNLDATESWGIKGLPSKFWNLQRGSFLYILCQHRQV